MQYNNQLCLLVDPIEQGKLHALKINAHSGHYKRPEIFYKHAFALVNPDVARLILF
jgi:hypothetical protein